MLLPRPHCRPRRRAPEATRSGGVEIDDHCSWQPPKRPLTGEQTELNPFEHHIGAIGPPEAAERRPYRSHPPRLICVRLATLNTTTSLHNLRTIALYRSRVLGSSKILQSAKLRPDKRRHIYNKLNSRPRATTSRPGTRFLVWPGRGTLKRLQTLGQRNSGHTILIPRRLELEFRNRADSPGKFAFLQASWPLSEPTFSQNMSRLLLLSVLVFQRVFDRSW